jgi:outer membrane immunogenic protein
MKRILFASSLSLALASGSALAADMAVKAPPPALAPAAYSWTGCYLDAGAGYGLWNQDHYYEAGPPVETSIVPLDATQTAGGRGWLGRFGGGCDYQIGSVLGYTVVVGAFADYDVKNLTGAWGDSLGFGGSESETSSWAVGPRIGFAVVPGTLAYADGGYTQARFGSFGLTTATGVPLPFNMAAATYDGWFLGGGTETQLSSWFSGLPAGLFLRTEYRYSSFNANNVPVLFTPTGTLIGSYEHNTNYEQTITTSLVWRFNATGSAVASASPTPAYLPLKAPPQPAPVAYSWTGCYVDAGGGYGLWNQDHYFEAGPPVVPGFIQLDTTQTAGGRGWLGRFGGGCDVQDNANLHLVLGVLADYDVKNLTGTWSDTLGFAGSETENSSWAVGPRIGYAVTPATLAYADGGYTQARFGSFGLTTATGIALPFNMATTTYDGWFVGGGTETALSSWLSALPAGLFLRSEYRYSSFNNKDVPILFTPTGALTGAYERQTNYEQSITTSLVWKFNWLAH